MDNLPKKVAEETFVKIIAESLLSGVVVLTTTILALFSIPANSELASHKTELSLLGVIIAYSVGSLWISYRTKKSKFYPQFEKVDSDFILEKIEICYQWISPEEIIYTRRYRLRATRNDVSRFMDKYRWSGDSKAQPQKTVADHRIEYHPPDGLYHFFDICFPRTYKKDEIIETGAIWRLQDIHGTSSPFISRTIHEPTEELILIVELPLIWGIENIFAEESPDAGAKRNIKAETRQMTNGKCEWRPNKPIKLLHHYKLHWQPQTKRS